eukprot:4784424-Pyramimonas_sp.AAC.1
MRRANCLGPPGRCAFPAFSCRVAESVGKAADVIRLCDTLIEDPGISSYLDDIRVATALALCEIAREAIDSSKVKNTPSLARMDMNCTYDTVTEACRVLTEAFAVLSSDKSLAPSLLAEIKSSLKQLCPLSVIEELSCPVHSTIDDYDLKRDEALETLSQLLEESQQLEPSKATVNPEYLKYAMTLLTAAEAVSLIEWQDVADAQLAGATHNHL